MLPIEETVRARRRIVLFAIACAVIVLLSFLAYAPVRHAGFLQDDRPIVEINPTVHRGDWAEIFSTDYWGGVGGSETSLYRPVTILSFALERGRDGRVELSRSHLLNVLLSALAAVALMVLARRIGLGPWASFLAGGLFALHPLHVSVVAGLVGRAEILAALFTLVALVLQSRAGEWTIPGARASSPGPLASRLSSWGAALSVFCALCSKEVALAAPILLGAQEVLFRRPPAGQRRGRFLVERAAALAPSALAVAIYALLRVRALGVFPGLQRPRLSENVLVGLDGAPRLFTALGIAGRYFRLLVFPHPLSADYSGNVIGAEKSLLAPLPLLGLAWLAVLAALASAPLLARSLRTRASFAALLFLLPYLSVGNLLVLVGIGFAERLAYVPSAGFCLLCALLLAGTFALDDPSKLRARRVAGGAIALGILALGFWQTRIVTRDWRSVETVFAAAARSTPASPRAQFTLGKIWLDRGRTDDALRQFQKTVDLWPDFSAAWYEKGVLEQARGASSIAERSFRQALRVNPWHADAAAALGDLLLASGQDREAFGFYRRAARFGRRDVVPKLREILQRRGPGASPIP